MVVTLRVVKEGCSYWSAMHCDHLGIAAVSAAASDAAVARDTVVVVKTAAIGAQNKACWLLVSCRLPASLYWNSIWNCWHYCCCCWGRFYYCNLDREGTSIVTKVVAKTNSGKKKN